MLDIDYYILVNLKVYLLGYIKLLDRVMLYKNFLFFDVGYFIGVEDLVILQCIVLFGVGFGV